jgi:hypothetical protein
MAHRITNQSLNQLLMSLGFIQGEVTELNHRVWRHNHSGSVIRLPNNKLNKAPRPADLVGLKAQLHLQGHLDEAEFDAFLSTSKLPAQTL